MSLGSRVVLPIIFSTLMILEGCGGNGLSIAKPVAPPGGKFSNSNLSGTYVFSVSGIDVNGAPYSVLGSFTANGSGGNGPGGITGGTIDMNDADLSTPVPNASIAGNSTYTVGIDGRGRATLNTSTPLGTINLDFVLADSSHGLVTEFDTKATGSGTIDLQTAGTTPAGSYAFIFSGADVSNGTANLFATVGNFTLSGGAISSGIEDFNESGFAYTNQALAGNIVLGPSSSPATTLTTQQFGTQTYDVFAINGTHLKFIEMDASGTLSGDAYSQTSTTIPAGTFAFTLAGSFPGANAASVAGGFIVTDGSGNIINTSTEDANNTGTVSPAPITFTGAYTAAGTGRITLGNFVNFSEGSAYAAYPSSGGLLLLEIDDSGIMVGAAYPQTSGAAFAASQGYALNLSGVNLGATTGFAAEVDDIAEFTANSSGSTVTGVIDENASGSPAYGVALSGTYGALANGRGQIGANAGNNSNSTLSGGFNLTFYTVDGTTFPFIETDSGQVGSGVFVAQNPTASSSALAQSRMFVVQPLVRPNGAHWRKK
jgi:hypothetical protein